MIKKSIKLLLNKYQSRGLFFMFQSISLAILKRDIVTPVLLPLYKKYVKLNGGIIELDGCKLDVASHIITDSMLREIILGYEYYERKLIDQHLSKEHATIELGAGIGFVACYTNKKLNHNVRHVVIEANDGLIPIIKRNREINHSSFDIQHAAYAPDKEVVTFHQHEHFFSSGTRERNAEYMNKKTVPGTDLEAILNTFSLDNVNLIVDIEGAEHDLIDQEIEVIKNQCRILVVEFHELKSSSVDKKVELILENGFEIRGNHGNVWAFINK